MAMASGGLSVNVKEITIAEDVEDTARNVMEYITNTFPEYDGTKMFLVLVHDWTQFLDRTDVLVFSEGKITGYSGTAGLVTNRATTNTNLSAIQSTTDTVRLRAGDKYLVVG